MMTRHSDGVDNATAARVKRPERQRDVVPAEAEGIGDRVAVVAAAGLTATTSRSISGSRSFRLRRGRYDAVAQGLHRQHGLHRSGGAQRMTQRRFGRIHRRRVATESISDGAGFGQVTEIGSGGVGVDVVDVGRGETGQLDGRAIASPARSPLGSGLTTS